MNSIEAILSNNSKKMFYQLPNGACVLLTKHEAVKRACKPVSVFPRHVMK